MRMRRKNNRIPRMEQCSHVLAHDPTQYHGCWLEKHSERKVARK